MDATVATGAASMMAIRVLLDHDVPEDNITLCSLLMASSGVHSIAYAFPKVQIVTTAVDPEINDKFYIKPGIGKRFNLSFLAAREMHARCQASHRDIHSRELNDHSTHGKVSFREFRRPVLWH